MLGKIGIGAKLGLIVAIAVVALLAVAAMGLGQLRQNLVTDREVKTRHLVEMAHSLVEHFHDQEKAGALSSIAAQSAALAALKRLRYDGSEYVWVNDMHPRMVMHPYKADLDGRDVSDFTDPNGKRLFLAFVEAVKRDGGGFVDYLWPKPGFNEPVRKISYVKAFAPWGWVVGSGIYLDDVDSLFRSHLMTVGTVFLAVVAMMVLGSVVVSYNIVHPLRAVGGTMVRLAGGDLDAPIPYNDRRDQIGTIARALEVFKRHAIDRDRLRREQDGVKQQAEAENRRALHMLANDFERAVKGVADTVFHAAETITSTAEGIGALSNDGGSRSLDVVEASEEARRMGGDLVVVSGEMTASVASVSAHTGESIEIARAAVTELERAVTQVQGLSTAAERVGAIINLISGIAAQTNLLALNATIEAARAGDAGKGFAVVANEVKALANQTARATEDIAEQVGAIQTATHEAVAAIDSIGNTIRRMDVISEDVSAAMEVQRQVNQRIATIVSALANQAETVTDGVVNVAQMAARYSASAIEVAWAADDIQAPAEQLEAEVESFLGRVRA